MQLPVSPFAKCAGGNGDRNLAAAAWEANIPTTLPALSRCEPCCSSRYWMLHSCGQLCVQERALLLMALTESVLLYFKFAPCEDGIRIGKPVGTLSGPMPWGHHWG